MGGYVTRRMREGSWKDAKALTDYFHANLCHGDESWGGCAHATLLLPGAYARSPLCDRIPALHFSQLSAVSFIYGGDGDWMAASHARALKCRSAEQPRLPIEVATVAGAGHNLMVDNPLGFVAAVMASGGGSFDGLRFGEEALQLDQQMRGAKPGS